MLCFLYFGVSTAVLKVISNITNYHKTRIAPTPSGFLHLGNVLSFAITAGLAQKTGAKILLRIDDLDRLRVNDEYLQNIFDTLNFLQIPWDEGPRDIKEFKDKYSQLHRMPLYNVAFKQLYDAGLVFACTCSRKQMREEGSVNSCTCFEHNQPLTAQNVNWRLLTTGDDVAVKNYDGHIIRAALPASMHNFIIKKKDGFPSYQLASLIDDVFYGIDLVVRGDDLWPSTLAQHELALALKQSAFHHIGFFHHPLLMEQSGQKLSKSAGATSVRYLRQHGHTAADIYTLTALMLGINQHTENWQQLAAIAFRL